MVKKKRSGKHGGSGNRPQEPPIKFVSWDQSEVEVSITLETAKKSLNPTDLDTEFNDTDVKVLLKGGAKWCCQFNQLVDKESAKVAMKGNKVFIRIAKQQIGQHWAALQAPAKDNNIHATTASFDSGEDKIQKDMKEKDLPQASGDGLANVNKESSEMLESCEPESESGEQHTEPAEVCDGANMTEAKEEKITKPRAMEEEKPKCDLFISEGDLKGAVGGSLQDGDKPEKTADDTSTEESGTVETAEEDVYVLPHIKHDHFDKGTNLIVIHVYVKEVDQSSIQVTFEDKRLAINFHTKDARFLKLHDNSPATTRFQWAINLSDVIIPSGCKYKVTGTSVELTVQKSVARKWTSLEALPNKASKSTPSKWLPVNNDVQSAPAKPPVPPPVPPVPPPLPSPTFKGKDRRVIFDEMNTEKRESQREREGKGAAAELTLETSQKPTCMVSPLSKQHSDKPQVVEPGMTGLDNLGNTCFMNSVLQVLANTTELRDYFLEARFQKEINPENPLGSGGKLAVAFAVLMKILWSGKNYSHAPLKLKNLIAQKASQFTGFAQHDAQEFMAFLLDGLHEDLNRVRDKPYTQTVDSDGRPDEVVANEAWKIHKLRNDSFIVDMFQGQYKSKLVCPICSKVSITFDPFSILPVPLPKKQRLLPIIFLAKDPYKKPVKYMVRLPSDANVEELKEAVAAKTGVSAQNLRVFEAYQRIIHQIFKRGASLSTVNDKDLIFVCEALSEKMAGEPVVELICMQRLLVPKMLASRCSACNSQCEDGKSLRRCTRCYRAAYCSQSCQRQDWQQGHSHRCRSSSPDPVGMPFYISLPESQATYSRLVTIMQAFSRYSVDIFQPPVTESSSGSDTSGSGSDTSSSSSPPHQSKLEEDQKPQDAETIAKPLSAEEEEEEKDVDTQATQPCDSSSTETSHLEEQTASSSTAGTSTEGSTKGPPTRYVMGRPQVPLQKEQIAFHVRAVSQDGGNRGPVLEDQGEDPLDFTGIYFLAMDWKNVDRCKPYVMVQSKDLDCEEDESMHLTSLEEGNNVSLEQCISMFTEPEILSPEHAWYCPSCKEHREATKQLSIWKLPEILIIQLKRFSFRNLLWRDKIDKLVQFPTRGLDLTQYFIGNSPVDQLPPIYDLYGVVNHHGGLLGGHYTSFVRCPSPKNPNQDEVGWRLCDDSMVSNTREKQVVTKAAYVLFYRRRSSTIPDPQSPLGGAADQSDEEDDEFLDVEPATEFMLDTTPIGGAIPLAGSSFQGGGDSDMTGMLAAGSAIPTVVSDIDNMEDEPLLSYHDDSRNNYPESRPLQRSCSYTDMDAVD